MSSNIPISGPANPPTGSSPTTGSSPPIVVEKVIPHEAVPKEKVIDNNAAAVVNTTLAQMSTRLDLKQAELKGEHVSISDEQLIKAIDRAIKSAEGAQTSLEFSIHRQTKEIMVKVINKETGEIIREIPPEKTLDFVARLWKMAGILVDERR